MRLSGRAAIVTGAASGIGRASAELFAREGAKVLAVDLPGKDLPSGDGIVPFEKSVGDADAADVIVGAALKAFGQLDIVAPLRFSPGTFDGQPESLTAFSGDAIGKLFGVGEKYQEHAEPIFAE